MKQKIYKLKINGVIEIDQPINPETEYELYLKRIQNDQGKVFKQETDETETIKYTMVNLDIALLKAGEKTIQGKPAKGSISSIIRNRLRDLWEMAYSGDYKEEEFYQMRMNKVLDDIDKEINNYN